MSSTLVLYTQQGGITTAGLVVLAVFLLCLFLVWGDFGGEQNG